MVVASLVDRRPCSLGLTARCVLTLLLALTAARGTLQAEAAVTSLDWSKIIGAAQRSTPPFVAEWTVTRENSGNAERGESVLQEEMRKIERNTALGAEERKVAIENAKKLAAALGGRTNVGFKLTLEFASPDRFVMRQDFVPSGPKVKPHSLVYFVHGDGLLYRVCEDKKRVDILNYQRDLFMELARGCPALCLGDILQKFSWNTSTHVQEGTGIRVQMNGNDSTKPSLACILQPTSLAPQSCVLSYGVPNSPKFELTVEEGSKEGHPQWLPGHVLMRQTQGNGATTTDRWELTQFRFIDSKAVKSDYRIPAGLTVRDMTGPSLVTFPSSAITKEQGK
jgi:hypothetical protein